ncbi:MAG TPA: nitroreductase/quinone reductase family protein [Chloroflexaceae bacterium]|nr:nitroreductase/quinone reductase family protein [Chloroflexaceae bacterium]
MGEVAGALREGLGRLLGTPVGVLVARVLVLPLDRLVHRLSGGRLLFANAFFPTLVLTTTGARSGLPRSAPLIYARAGPAFVVLASNYGGASHPAWYHNLRANPACTVVVGGRTVHCIAREADGAERDELWRRAERIYAAYRAYEASAGGRRIPVVVLEPAG